MRADVYKRQVFYLVFQFAIVKFDLKTPGREDEDAEAAEANITLANLSLIHI